MEFVDIYDHDLDELIYFPKSIPTDEIIQANEKDLDGCHCISECQYGSCACLDRSGFSYTYVDRSDLSTYSLNELNDLKPNYECSLNCKCTVTCGNRLVQYGPNPFLTVKKCNDSKGLGLFTNKYIKKGTFICEYAGELINEFEYKKRFNSYKTRLKMNYVFCLNEHFGDKTVKTFIDPTYYGNIGRYINHSCDPNCNLVIIRIDTTIPGLYVFANKDIPENCELTFNYGNVIPGNCSNQTKCLCNSPNCQQFLPFDDTVLTADL
ncbi:probable histone-lysine N-methyltransferase set-23 [Aethina tumida]|uniref:probable histone-lysine N-methyltransferase set-23 n=1 Tax=Aethina tumida TaxID=116153 RepID=UPI00096B3684|nr:probable histone-lysine N-methyltransferase set-23 [Aethina tumida]